MNTEKRVVSQQQKTCRCPLDHCPKADIIKLYMTEIKIPIGYTIPQALALFLEEMKKDSGRSYYGQYHGIDLFSGDTVDMAVERLKGERKVV